jgi:hypothetical protein
MSALLLVVVLLPIASATFAVYHAPYAGSTMTSTSSLSATGTGSNTVLGAPSFSLTSGAVLESISSKSTGATAVDDFHETSLAGMVGIFWSCAGTLCSLPTQVFLSWSLQGSASGVTTCPTGLGGGSIFADSQIRLAGSVLSTTGGVIGSSSSLIASAVQPGCPGSSSSPLSGTYVLAIAVTPVGPFTGTQTWTITATVNLDTHSGGSWSTTTAPLATGTGTIARFSSLSSVTIT